MGVVPLEETSGLKQGITSLRFLAEKLFNSNFHVNFALMNFKLCKVDEHMLAFL